MSFRNIVFSAICVGVITGLIYGSYQHLAVNPIIHAAEQFEVSSALESESHDDGHSHSHEAWGPEDGIQRALATLGSNILVAIAFALILLAAISTHNLYSTKPAVNARTGIFWGVAILASVFIAPALLGLHPEIPGTLAASVPAKQIWWLGCAISTAIGIALIYYAKSWIKLSGVFLLVVPHIIGAPHPQTSGYANTDPEAVLQLTKLSSEFVSMTTIGMLIFFILLGCFCGLASSRMKSPG